MSQTNFPFSPVVIGVFRPSPARPIRASGGGLDGSDPPFLTAGAVSRWGGVTPRVTRGVTPPTAFGGVAPVSIYPCGKAPTTAARRARRARRAAQMFGCHLARGPGLQRWIGTASAAGSWFRRRRQRRSERRETGAGSEGPTVAFRGANRCIHTRFAQ